MLRMGDEFLQTQAGNNNPYNQDNATTWLNWRRLDEHRDIFRFFQRMITFRKSHPSISRRHFWRDDIHWYGAGRTVDLSDSSSCLAFCLHDASRCDHSIYVMLNASPQEVTFGIHEGTAGHWKRAVDTSLTSPDDIPDMGEEPIVKSSFYRVQPRSVVVLLEQQ